jgi:hypothetical protein
MEINVIEVETKLHVLATNFSNSYFSNMYDQYQIVFENSNVVEEMEMLHVLSAKLDKRTPSFIINKDRALLDSILDSYTYLITVYKHITNVSLLSPKFKRYDMIKYLHDWCKQVSVNSTKEVVTPEFEEKISQLADYLIPTPTSYKTKQEEMNAKANAHFAKILKNK